MFRKAAPPRNSLAAIILGYFESFSVSATVEDYAQWNSVADGSAGPVLGYGEAIMTVKAVLDHKGTDVATKEPSADVASAVKLLAEYPIQQIEFESAALCD
jgi:hypothetical protein